MRETQEGRESAERMKKDHVHSTVVHEMHAAGWEQGWAGREGERDDAAMRPAVRRCTIGMHQTQVVGTMSTSMANYMSWPHGVKRSSALGCGNAEEIVARVVVAADAGVVWQTRYNEKVAIPGK